MDVVEEQRNLHYSKSDGKCRHPRSRRLVEYSAEFMSPGDHDHCCRPIDGWEDLEKRGIFAAFDHFLERKERVVWVDLGCGNAIALRQAKKYFEQTRRGIANLTAIGYDVLPVDMDEYLRYARAMPKRYDPSDWDGKYAPEIRNEDIHHAVFPEPPDIVTCIQVLQYSQTPLQIFSNAAKQLREGAVLLIPNMNVIRHSAPGNSQKLIDRMMKQGQIPGFRFLYKPRAALQRPDTLLMERTSEPIEDFTFGFVHQEAGFGARSDFYLVSYS
jgi:hypothetical protein